MQPVRPAFLAGYSDTVQERAAQLRDEGVLERVVLERHPDAHGINNNAFLYTYVQDLKKEHLKSSPPLGKIRYCEKISTVHRALGLHTYAVRVQGNKLKSKNELRVGTLFRDLPADFLRMIVVHELAHLREKDHDKAFYRLCCHMEPEYHQWELDLRLLLFARQDR